jgi:aspartate kinase
MSIVVQKFGGTSVASPEKIKSAAKRIHQSLNADSQAKILVVISAMGKQTDILLDYAHQISSAPSKRELDMLLTVGERASMALLSIALGELGVKAISLTGSQSGILTTAEHGEAKIKDIRPKRIHSSFEQSDVVIVAGFQGMCLETGEITTLGRGGSDLTAIALAHVMQAASCEIFTDVDGVFDRDPRKVKKVEDAEKFEFLSHELAIKLAESGAKVIHDRAARLAKAKNVSYEVKNAHNQKPGTAVSSAMMELPDLLFISQPTQGSILKDGQETSGLFVTAIGKNAKSVLQEKHKEQIEWLVELDGQAVAKILS